MTRRHDDDCEYAITPFRCRCPMCGTCGPKRGWIIRQNVLAKSAMFKVPRLLTLKVDRHGTLNECQGFESPEDAHRKITDGRFLARLMRHLGITRWVVVLEFQMKTGDG